MIFAQIYSRYYDGLATRSFQILANEALAKEAVMDTFLTLWINREEVAAMEKPVAWLYECTTHKSLNILRSEKRRKTVNMDDSLELPQPTSMEKEIDAREMARLVQKAIDLLPPRQREIFRLVKEKGWTRDQVAQQYNLSENTVKNHITDAQHSLRRILKALLTHLLI